MADGFWHVTNASAEPLLQRLEGVQKSGKGWRACCPACGGRSRKLSIAEGDSRVLLHCFAGCKSDDVLAAVGMTWKDIMPPRHWPQSPEERRAASRAIREAGWASALSVLQTEAFVVQMAGAAMLKDQPIEMDDYQRLVEAVKRIEHAASVLVEVRR